MNSQMVRERTRGFRRRLRRFRRPAFLGTLRRTQPLSNDFGYDRGTPVDRYYIERFLARHRSDVRGRSRGKEPIYTKRFGTQVERCDVLDLDASNPLATFVADLADAMDCRPTASVVSSSRRRCSNIYRTEAAVRHGSSRASAWRCATATVPAVSRLAYRARRRRTTGGSPPPPVRSCSVTFRTRPCHRSCARERADLHCLPDRNGARGAQTQRTEHRRSPLSADRDGPSRKDQHYRGSRNK